MNTAFSRRLRAGERLLSTFIKTPGVHAVEIAACAGLDAVVLDAEHAPFCAASLDLALLACRAGGIAGIVRVLDARPASIGAALDLGAAGVLVPHIRSAQDAREAVAAAHYRHGGQGCRGYSNSPRAGGYGAAAMAAHLERQDEDVLVLCQIEDAEAMDRLDEIAAVPGVDCLFVGRADLALSYGLTDLHHARVVAAQRATFEAARRRGLCAGIFVGDAAAVPAMAKEGAQFFVVGSDQSALRAGLLAVRDALKDPPGA